MTMSEYLGELVLDTETGLPIIKAASDSTRAQLISKLRRLAPTSTVVRDGSFLKVDLQAAMALRSEGACNSLAWSNEAAGMVDNFAVGYATRGRARRRLLELLQLGV